MVRLYVIGNGFDLHHRIPSSYSAFGEYLQAVDPDAFENVEKYLYLESNDAGSARRFWANFEQALADFGPDDVIEDASQFLVSYAAEDWSDSGHHDYQYEIERVVTSLSTNLKARFSEWIKTLPIPDAPPIRTALAIDTRALFLSFNYTVTLSKAYGVPPDRIVYIHGCADSGENLVLGHGWNPVTKDSLNKNVDPELIDTRELQGNEILDEYFELTYKPAEKVIANWRAFFDGLIDVDEVYILGHSMSEVDMPYLFELARNVSSAATWVVSYYGEDEKFLRAETMKKLGIQSYDLIELSSLALPVQIIDPSMEG
ncbi:bacteriophage abortive infection AbiH family protein [Lysobacter sp. 5GHs7-4]|uniref:bacteriophage abortive infection AbiH family protein n=1 Tax=Lysobacter sp. 5GHs7-4 TaxID=2904253 RepID=UPI001E59B5B9|nr:bacteriophage abortive infection AbiH family protein [Lysobacter sp. 5GHs7-4]UHQ23814.1 bacteriophage abortive infection AbiH family protein [Lysobacter sp. 5GHs7-4]